MEIGGVIFSLIICLSFANGNRMINVESVDFALFGVIR